MKKLFLFIIIVGLITHPLVIAYAVDLDYWLSDTSTNEVGFCSPANVRVASLSGGIGLDTAKWYTAIARGQWSCRSTTSNSNVTGNIYIYDGGRTELLARCPDLADNNGYTYMPRDERNPIIATATYQRSTKYIRHISKVWCYIPKQNISEANYLFLYTHELGHALGFIGHHKYPYYQVKCVMYNGWDADWNYYQVQAQDRWQCDQIYDLFGE